MVFKPTGILGEKTVKRVSGGQNETHGVPNLSAGVGALSLPGGAVESNRADC